MKTAIPLLSIVALLVACTGIDARAEGREPVEIGGDAQSDACASLGRIAGLDPKGDNFLSVREGPGAGRRELDRLRPDATVAICDERGSWLGIVYPAPETAADCGLSSPEGVRAPYRGPCRSGWVHRRFVEIVAG